jgi:hypothetical protein
MNTPDELIWWLSQQATTAVIEQNPPLPEYIQRELRQRDGGRGSSAIYSSLTLDTHWIPWYENHPMAQRIVREDAGGLVIRGDDLAIICLLPGFVTDTSLELICDMTGEAHPSTGEPHD